MTSITYPERVSRDIRLLILQAVAEEDDEHLSDTLIVRKLEQFSHRKSRDFVRNELRWMEKQVGAVEVIEEGDAFVAKLTRAGRDHVNRRAFLEGVARPDEV